MVLKHETVMEHSVKPYEILAITEEKAKALKDPIRISIVSMLSHQPMCVEDIVNQLAKQGSRKAATTVRHHIDVLKKANLIELTKTEDVRGGSLKYYASKINLHNSKLPKSLEKDISPIIPEYKNMLKDFSKALLKRHKNVISNVANKLKPCPYCNTDHFKEYVIVDVMNRAIAKLLKDKEFQKLLR